MKKKTKSNLIKFISFFFVVIFGIITSYYLDFNGKVDILNSDNQDNVVNNVDNLANKKDESYFNTIEPKLQITFVDVGQADAVIIKQDEHYMLIDAGKNDTEEHLLNYLDNMNITSFDYVVGTHVHEDHIGGMDKVIKNFDIKNIFFPKQTSTTKTFENFVLAVKGKNMKLYAPNVGEEFNLGDARFKILAPNGSNYEEANDYSIVIKLTYKNKSFLFMGDAEKLSEQEILDKNFDLKADVLKLGHHGSKTSTTNEFLKYVSPETTVISVGKDNSYKHPSRETMIKLKTLNIPVYRTDESGTIILNCDGDNIAFNVKEGSYNYGK